MIAGLDPHRKRQSIKPARLKAIMTMIELLFMGADQPMAALHAHALADIHYHVRMSR